MLSIWISSLFMLIGNFHAGDAIYNGRRVSPAEFPYMVEISERTRMGRDCSGAIIDPKHILTAGHCVFDLAKEEIIITAGAVDLLSMFRIQQWGVASIHLPEGFEFKGYRCGRWRRMQGWVRDTWQYFTSEINNCTVHNDIAVLKLKGALPFGHDIKAVNLPDSGFLPYCRLCAFAGWGATQRDGPISQFLLSTEMEILRKLATVRLRKLPSNEFYAVDPFDETGPLQGDCGAPLVYENVVYGVLSKYVDHDVILPVFTDVFSHLKFIRKAMKDSATFV